jgi:Putative addiction module component
MTMHNEDVEMEALKLDPKARARLAGKLLESLEDLSEEENARLWAEEAERRDLEMEANPKAGRSADEVFRDVGANLK